MRIERISENQIRCTLTKSDLEEHELLLNDLAFGGDRAKDLFRDLMAQASEELGFEADDIPLMIEAVPVSSEKIVLIITKMDSPEELDDKFSKYMKPLEGILSSGKDDDEMEISTDSVADSDSASDDAEAEREKADGFSSLSQIFQEARKMAKERAERPEKKSPREKKPVPETHRIYRFSSLVQAMDACKKIYPLYDGENTLYKDAEENFYYLVLARNTHSPEEFARMGNVLSEYGLRIPYTYGAHAYFKEHFAKIIESNAVDTLASL